jgi:hypothetical protein
LKNVGPPPLLTREGLREELREEAASWRDGECDVLRMSGGRQPLRLLFAATGGQKPLLLLLAKVISVC